MSFSIDKWYLDVVTDQGTVLIFYAARLQWGRLRVDYASALRAVETGPARERATISRVEPPAFSGNALTWKNQPLDIDGAWQRVAAPIRRTLASDPDGTIQWTCHMPSARATVRWGEERFEGLGYVERLELTMPPSELPFRTLRWGRHVSASHSLVWIDWAGPTARRWIWLDGEEQHAATLSGDAPSGLAGGAALCLRDRRCVRDQLVVAALRGLPVVLTRRLPAGIATMHEHKLVSRSSIMVRDTALDQGWALHEVVTR